MIRKALWVFIFLISGLAQAHNPLVIRINTLDRVERALYHIDCIEQLKTLRQDEMEPVRKYRLSGVAADPQMQAFYNQVLKRLDEAIDVLDPIRYTRIHGPQKVGVLLDSVYLPRLRETATWLNASADSHLYPKLYAKMMRRVAKHILPTPQHYSDLLGNILNKTVAPESRSHPAWKSDRHQEALRTFTGASYMVRSFLAELAVALETPQIIGQGLLFRDILAKKGIDLKNPSILAIVEEAGWDLEFLKTKEFDVIFEKDGVVHLGDVKFSASFVRTTHANYHEKHFGELKHRVTVFKRFLKRLHAFTGVQFKMSFFFVGYGLPHDMGVTLEEMGALIEDGAPRVDPL